MATEDIEKAVAEYFAALRANDEGLIQTVHAYWNLAALMAQLQ
ncbi:MAG: hypothetical protein ABR577_18940 [Pyrinomonadaceae bacterium]